jgi:putative ABC transport system permease protein
MQDILLEYMGMDVSAMLRLQEQSFGMNSFSMMRGATLWQELLPGKDGSLINPLLQKQYDLVYGAWPKAYNEIVLVVDENNELDDLTLYALGLKPKSEIDRVMKAAMDKEIIDYDVQKWSYEEICEMDFRTILSSDCYIYDEATGTYVDLRETSAGLKYLYDNGLSLKVSGIIRPNEDAVATMLTGSIGYTYKLTEHAIEKAKDAPAALAQQEDPGTDIFTGLPFKDTDGARTVPEKATGFKEHIASLDEAGKARAYVQIMSIPSPEMVQQAVGQAIGSMARADIEAMMAQALTAQMGISADEIMGYISGMSDEDIRELFAQMAEEQFKAQYAEGVRQQLAAMTPQQLAAALDMAMAQYTDEQCAAYYDEVLVFSNATYEENLIKLGRVDLDNPARINLYAATFADKDVIEDAIAAYNETVDDLSEIRYTDYVGLMMSSITTIINAITYVLIAFVAVSLIVSSIMIGVITLISVQERTKEIGILRAIGASKKNVSSMFNAETVIIGFTSGALGVLITYLLCIPVNLILHRLTGINNLSAILPVPVALVLVVISMLLTLIAGVIPSRSAAKKDPVVALRTE